MSDFHREMYSICTVREIELFEIRPFQLPVSIAMRIVPDEITGHYEPPDE